jgi:beta-lactamase class C
MLTSNRLPLILKPFEETVLKSLETKETPGVAIAIADKDTVHYLRGFGVKRLGSADPITPYTLFQMASLSKPISATALALLAEKELCQFQDHPRLYLPGFFEGESYRNLAIAHMLNHTAGVSYDGFEELIESYTPCAHILKKLKETTPSRKPGEHYEHQNVVYGLLGDLMERLTGKPIQSVLEEYLFKPLGMNTACVGLPALLDADDRAFPHMVDAEGTLIPANYYSHAYYIFPTAAGINASVQDLIPFVQLYLGKSPNLLSKELLHRLTTPTIDASSSLKYLTALHGEIKQAWYGLGWFIIKLAQEKVVYHTGWLNGFRNFLGFLPDHNIAIIVLTNTNNPTVAPKLGLEFLKLYLEQRS